MTTTTCEDQDVTTIDLTKTSPGGDDDQPERQLAPAPASPGGALATRTDKPLLPMWLRDRETLRAAIKATSRQAWRTVAGFLVGLLVLAPRLLLAWSWRGFGRLTRQLSAWIYDQDSADRRAGAPDGGEYERMHRVRRANLHARWLVAATIGVPVLVPVLAWLAPTVLAWLVGLAAGAWLIKLIPGRGIYEVAAGAIVAVVIGINGPAWLALVPRPPAWAAWWLAALAVLALGWHGRPKDRPVVGATLAAAGPPPLRPTLIVEALCSLGNAKMTAKTEENPRTAIRLLTDVHRHGPGVQVDLELPPGVPATWVMEKREELAAALRRELGCVWPSVGDRHPGHLVLYVADQPMSKSRQPRWPLADAPRIDIFEPQPVATDQRGRWVNLPLAYSNGVIGAIPRQGKTFALRELALVAGMDPRVKVYAFDGKGTGDLSGLAPFAHYIGVGDEEDDILEQLIVMRGLREEMRRRARVIRALPREECPESKVTSALAERRDLGLEPIAAWVDECFPAGTLIGGVPIEALQVGDIVPSWDECARVPCEGRVTGVMSKTPESLVQVWFTGGDSLVCTPNHPLMTRDGWRSAGGLDEASEVLSYAQECYTHHWRRVDRVEILQRGSDGRYGGLCPDGLVYNFEVAGTHTYLVGDGVVAHNCQTWFLYGAKTDKRDKQIREEFVSICTDLAKRGPALGIWLFLASQQVNADTIPTSISNNAVIRLCLKIFGQVANDQILGIGARKEGIDATMFATNDKGIAYLRADGSDAKIVRMVHGLDAVEAEKLAQKIRVMRLGLGRLTGQAADEDNEQPQILDVDLLDDVREVMAAEQHRNMSLAEILDALRLLRPQLYGPWDVTALGSALRGAGVKVDPVHVPGMGTAKGVRWGWLPGDDAA